MNLNILNVVILTQLWMDGKKEGRKEEEKKGGRKKKRKGEGERRLGGEKKRHLLPYSNQELNISVYGKL